MKPGTGTPPADNSKNCKGDEVAVGTVVGLAAGGSAAGGSPTTEVVRLVVAFASVLGAVVTSIVFAVTARAANRVPGDILLDRLPTDLAEALARAAELEE